MELLDGVHSLPLQFQRGDREMTIHPAVAETERGLVLIDVGLPGAVDRIEDQIADLGYGLDDVRMVLATHQDADHVGGLAEALDRTGAIVFVHEDDAPVVAGEAPPLKGSADERYAPVSVGVELVGGETFRTRSGPMRVVSTAGHTPGHVSLYFQDQGLLLAADALTVEDGELAGPAPEHTSDMETAIESVARLSGLDVDRVLCYHGGLVEAGTVRIAEIHASMRE